jgi:two-component system KDP operon response regulator KdpE
LTEHVLSTASDIDEPVVETAAFTVDLAAEKVLKETHYLRVYLAQLRRKLEDDPGHPVHLLTEAGMGYRFQQ